VRDDVVAVRRGIRKHFEDLRIGHGGERVLSGNEV